jgi:hypothetical protein
VLPPSSYAISDTSVSELDSQSINCKNINPLVLMDVNFNEDPTKHENCGTAKGIIFGRGCAIDWILMVQG